MSVLGTKSINLPALPGSIPDTQLVLVPDPVTGELYRSTFGQMKADIILQIGDLSYLDDIIEVPTVDALPQPGQVKKIYVITSGPDINTQWRWGGSIYIEFPQGSGDVAGEAIIRGNADATLQANINAEIANRQTADTNLQNNINAEALARQNADTTINTRLSSEINAARTNESILNGKIDAEGQIRATADNALDTRVTALENGAAAGVTKEYVDEADNTLQTNLASETAARIDGDALKVDKVAGMGLSSNDFTTDEKTKLAGLESSKFKGTYPTKDALDAANAGGEGNYADVDAGAGADVARWIWDASDNKWVLQQGTSTAETAASIKTKYESNPDTNAYTDAEKAKLAGLENYDDTAINATVANKVDKVTGKGLSTEDYTTAEKTKLAGIVAGAQVNDANTTLQGNIFNGISQLVKTDAAGKLPAIDGSQLTNLPTGTTYTGTANRISITAGVIDISAAYVGQNTITTLGIITTGTWQGTAIASGYGGTGFSTYTKGDIIYASAANTLAKLGMATVPDGYVLTAASGLPVWAAASGGGGGTGWGLSGNAVVGGNFIGTTNAQPLVFKTNNTTAFTLGTDGIIDFGSTYGGKIYLFNTSNIKYGIGMSVASPYVQFFNAGKGWSWNEGTGGMQPAGTGEIMRLDGAGLTLSTGGISMPGNATIGGNLTLSGSFSTGSIVMSNTLGVEKALFFSVSTSKYGIGMLSDATQQFFTSSNNGWTWNVGTGGLQTAGTGEWMKLTAKTSALLTLTSTNQGFLQPRMTLTQWGAIATKAEGLQGWNTSDHGQMWFDGTRSIGFRYNGTKFQGYDGTSWLDLN